MINSGLFVNTVKNGYRNTKYPFSNNLYLSQELVMYENKNQSKKYVKTYLFKT